LHFKDFAHAILHYERIASAARPVQKTAPCLQLKASQRNGTWSTFIAAFSCGVCGGRVSEKRVADGHGNPAKRSPLKMEETGLDTKLCSACGICVTCAGEALHISAPVVPR
jgi:hypothetical protein